MTDGLDILGLTALSIGFLHTVLGPDHYVPFIVMARARCWSLRRTVLTTLLCGLGHVLGSVALGFVGIAFGIAVFKLEAIEAVRGDLAGWLLVVFGLVYFLWGLRRAIRNRPHTHLHAHSDGTAHAHLHAHESEHLHAHVEQTDPCRVSKHAANGSPATEQRESLTPWILFAVFLFGPCEPLIPLLMYPAAEGKIWGVVWVTCVFGATTIVTMTTIVVAASLSAGALPFARFRRFSHALAGFAVLTCGIAVKVGL